MGGAALIGLAAEMKTGEGKDLVDAAAYLNGLAERCFDVTVNDYLAGMPDAEWNGAIDCFLGPSVGIDSSGFEDVAG